ncbi:uncharacterized protein LOC100909345 [Galendromus occidentalis]|uniref:Uncharacterized protein LOC100909345 n=1 Tax=Galendromus occidentalis TaxID=34638 RepID=A0AAJ6VW45_9ACAR|nr:uncharacterized protein LOC100909345 [Galendromus occidentalis]
MDEIYNEFISRAIELIPLWTGLFNECLRRGVIPEKWRNALLVLIRKGKGCPTDPKSWRGIAKKSCVYKLLSTLLTRRLTPFLEACGAIPTEQHGFRAGRSTLTACKILKDKIEKRLGCPRRPLYTLFVDSRSAFDAGSRSTVIEKLAMSGVPTKILYLISAILQRNLLLIDDRVASTPEMPLWDRIETDFSQETQKFSVQGLHRAETLFSVHPSATAPHVPDIEAAHHGNLIALSIDKLLHIFRDGEHCAAVELDSTPDCISITDMDFRLILVAKRDGELEVLDVEGNSLFSQRLLQPGTESGESFLFLECSSKTVCLLTCDLKVHWFRKNEKPNGRQAAEVGDDSIEEDVNGLQEDQADTENALQNFLDISSIDLSENDISDVSSIALVDDVLIFSCGAEGSLYRLDGQNLIRVWTAFPGGRIRKLLVGGGKRYLIALSEEGCVATICLRSFILIDYIMNFTFDDISLSQTTENDQVLKVQLIGLHESDSRKSISVYSLPSMKLEYSVDVEGQTQLAKHTKSAEEVVLVILNEELNAITVKSVNESSPENKLEILLLKKRFQEAEDLAIMFKLPVQDVYLEELYEVLNKLGPNVDTTDNERQIKSVEAAFERLLELYVKIASPMDVYQAVIRSLPAKLEQTARILDLLARDLSRIHNGNGNSSQLADVVLSQYKLATFKVIKEHDSFETWRRFLKTPTLTLITEYLNNEQASSALTIWLRHRDMISGAASSVSVVEFLGSLPSTIDNLKKWLVDGKLFTFVIRDFPECLDDLVLKIVDATTLAETRDPATFPQAPLALLGVLQREFDSALSLDSEETASLPIVINAMKMFQGLKNEGSPVYRMAALRRDLEFIQTLIQKYHVHLSLAELSSMPEKELMFYIMNRLESEVELRNFIHGTLKDTCIRIKIDLNDMLLEYIDYLRTRSDAAEGGDWEPKACKLFKLLSNPDFMSKAALSMIEAASIPWKQCVNEVFDIAIGMDFVHKEKLESVKRDIPLKMMLKKHAVPYADLDEEDTIALLIGAGETLDELLGMASKVGWSRAEILVEFLVKQCEDGDSEKVEEILRDYQEELSDTTVWSRLQCVFDNGSLKGLPAALIKHCLVSCSRGEFAPLRSPLEPMAEILGNIRGDSDEEVFCELYLYSKERGCFIQDILYDILVHAVQSSSPRVPQIASCFLRQDVHQRECLLAVQYLLANYTAVQMSDILSTMIARCNLHDSRYSLCLMWTTILSHFNRTSSVDPFVCWKFSSDYSARRFLMPATVVSSVNKLVNIAFDDSTREMSTEVWLEKILGASKQCSDELQRISAVDLTCELLECVRVVLSHYEIDEPPQITKMITDCTRTFIREHISSKYTDLFLTAHVLASLGSELLVPYFQSILAQSLSSTVMVNKLASVGLLVSDMLQLPGKAHLAATLKASEWCLKVSEYGVDAKRILKEGFNKKNADDVAEKLTQSHVMNIDLLRQFAQEFSLGSLNAHASKLFQSLVVSAAERVHNGKVQQVYLEVLPKADSILSLLTADETRDTLQETLTQVDDYCYEVLQYLYEKLVALNSNHQRELHLLLFLKGYNRKGKISAKENRQWTLLHPDLCLMPDVASRRIPLRVIMNKPQLVLESELGGNNIDDWVPVSHLINLAPDDMRILALSNLVKKYQQRASFFTCDDSFVKLFMKLVDDMTDEKKALSSALHMFNELPRGKTKVQIAHALWRYAEDCNGVSKLAQTFQSQFRALGCELVLRENSFEDNSYLRRCTDPNDLVNTILEQKLNTALSLEAARVLPVIEQTASLSNVKTKELLARFLHKWIMKARLPDHHAEVTATFNFNQIMNGASKASIMDFEEVIKIIRLLVVLPDDTGVQLMNQFLAFQNTTSYGVDQQLRSTLAVLCAFDEPTAGSLLGDSPKSLSLQCNQLLYTMKVRKQGLNLNSFLTSEELVCQVIEHLLQRKQRDSLILAFQLCRDFCLQDEATLCALVEAIAGRPDILEDAVLYLQRFKSVFGLPDYVQCWHRVKSL